MICAACNTGFDNTATTCPACGTPASAARRIGSFALICLQIARVAAGVGAALTFAFGIKALWQADYLQAALLLGLGTPIAIGQVVAFGLAVEYARTR